MHKRLSFKKVFSFMMVIAILISCSSSVFARTAKKYERYIDPETTPQSTGGTVTPETPKDLDDGTPENPPSIGIGVTVTPWNDGEEIVIEF